MNFEERFRLRSNRLKGRDYSQDGFYYVTICSHNRENIFGGIKNEKMVLNEIGEVAEKCWREIPAHFANAKLNEFVVMPNHLHGIVVIENSLQSNLVKKDVETLHATFLQNTNNHKFSQISPKPNSLSTMIRSFKSAATKSIHQIHPALDRVWQNRFFDHIIHDEEELNRVRDYILTNVKNWARDEENLYF